MNITISKNFFRLRRIGKKRRRSTGYYWIVWSYAETDNWVKVGFYNAATDIWKLPGSDRLYYDDDFIRVVERRIDPFPWVLLSKILIIVALPCLVYDAVYVLTTLPEFIHFIQTITK